MKIILSILNRVLVREFYRANAGLFFLVIGIGAGFMRSYEHIALAEFFSASPALMLIPILVWTIFMLNVVKFNRDILKRKENEFIFHVTLLPPAQKWIGLFVTLFYQLLPAILYGIFLMAFAIRNNVMATLLMIIASLIVLLFIGSFALSHGLHHPNQEKKVGVFTRYLNVSLTKPYPLFFPEWVARREPLLLFGTKIFSSLILLGVTQLYKTDVYDLRLLGLGIVIAFSAQVVVVWESHRFDNFHFSLNRNLPLAFTQRLRYFLITLLILVIPELEMIIQNFPVGFNTWSLVASILFALSIPVFYYGLLYAKDRDQEKFMPLVFFFSICWILLILFKIPLWGIGILNFAVGLWCMQKYYYSFEYLSKQES